MRVLRGIESGLLVLLLAGMIALAAWQVLARLFFDSGLNWGDAFVRVLVLWIAMLGAMIAARTDDHIRIDLLAKVLSPGAQRIARRLSALITAVVLALFTWASLGFVLTEYEDGAIAFASVPAWMCESIMPFAAAVMCLRYLSHVVNLPERKQA
jgi:TRAP-type C4-dicarboxylate transport system permease small subunit